MMRWLRLWWQDAVGAKATDSQRWLDRLRSDRERERWYLDGWRR